MTKNTKKIIQALAYLASKTEDNSLSTIKAYKLLWLADRSHLRQTGRTITGDLYYAMPKGMVPTDAKHLLDGEMTIKENPAGYFDEWITKVGDFCYKAAKTPNVAEFSKSDLEILDKVFALYGKKSGKELSELSHRYPEWRKYEDMLTDKNTKNSFPINMDLMFENCEEDDSMLFDQSQEVLDLTKEIYHEFNR